MRFLVAAISLSILAADLAAADAPTWGFGAGRNMVSPESGLPDSFDPGKFKPDSREIDLATTKNVRWVARLGKQTYASPAVAGGRVLIGSSDGDGLDAQDRLHRYNGLLFCFDEKDGALRWRLVVPWRREFINSDDFDIGIASTPTIDGNRAYLVTHRGEVLCIDMTGLQDGNAGPFTSEASYQSSESNFSKPQPFDTADIVWLFDMMKEVGVRAHITTNSSVLVHGDYVYASTCNAADTYGRKDRSQFAPSLAMLDRKTGKLVATDDEHIGENLNHGQYSSPSLAVVDGRELILYGGGDGWCYAFDAQPVFTGNNGRGILKTVWKFDCNPPEYRVDATGKPIAYDTGEGSSEIIGTPVFANNRVYVAIGQDWTHGGRKGCFNAINPRGSGDITRTGKIWQNSKIPRSYATAAVTNDLIFLPDQFGTLHCLNPAGETLWTHRLKFNISGSALVADGKVYVGSRDNGEFAILAAQPEKRVLSTIKLRTPLFGTPTAANGTLFVATKTHLYAIGK